MVPESFETFFLSAAGAGGALIGLLFVAISIHPQRTFGQPAVAGFQGQFLAEATLLTLVNGFVISSVALIPGIGVGWVALVLGAGGMGIAAFVNQRVAGLHRHGGTWNAPRRHLLRVVMLGLIATTLYAIQCLLGFQLIREPADGSPCRWLALVIIGLYAVGIIRAWTLLGDPQRGWSGWLNPLQDLSMGSEAAIPGAVSQAPLPDSRRVRARRPRHSMKPRPVA